MSEPSGTSSTDGAAEPVTLPTPEEFDELPLHQQADLLEQVQQRLAERLDASAS